MGMAAVAGDADNINKQARKTAYQLAQSNPLNVPTNWVKQEQASGRRPPTHPRPQTEPSGWGAPTAHPRRL